ncbi:hypothetical protein SA2016_0847 [Sinomonas atrocyanea]|uniref:NYN domain-containing protein n=1 Tax=Sinomonas atrocyanea TaxID=37927 RepID=A0A126ZYQ7_9MICC|nr:NYN domain-containing protein [Sinomonas atrocyanea]AMM31535.1 hypothetical protein SA2016_0847 [Sinomonas atrocyanea]GEB66034.1 hypothetical protein SAT01_34820 [Sinomonas atrocyanea]GGG63436.1 hypothetical protein GCM10007172_13380 [Sinomonas atrocyanea]
MSGGRLELVDDTETATGQAFLSPRRAAERGRARLEPGHKVGSGLCNRRHRRNGKTRQHKVSVCEATGLPRLRDRHQALQAAKTTRSRGLEVCIFACPACGGVHLELTASQEPAVASVPSVPAAAFLASLESRKKRYVLADIENPTRGARASCRQVATFWDLIKKQAPGIAPHDHVVVGASRSVARRYRRVISGENVKWVVGADAPDGADHALLAAIDLRRVARDFDELVIISGDHAFADLARRAKALGLTVHVVTAEHRGKSPMLSRELAAIANTRSFVRLEARKQKQENLARIRQVSGRMRPAAVDAA